MELKRFRIRATQATVEDGGQDVPGWHVAILDTHHGDILSVSATTKSGAVAKVGAVITARLADLTRQDVDTEEEVRVAEEDGE